MAADGRIDPRSAAIAKRLAGIKRILVFASGKGGVGKSSCSVVSSLLLARRGRRVGLMDLDFQGASDHLFLGAELVFPEEQGGILPVSGPSDLRFMSIALFSREQGIPMRGVDLSNALVELLAVTIWGDLDYLVLDMPPGMGDEVLDVLHLIESAEILLVTSASVVSARVVARFVEVCERRGSAVLGIVENLRPVDLPSVTHTAGQVLAAESGVQLLCSIPHCADFEASIGDPEALASGLFAQTLDRGLRGVTQ